MLVSCNSSLADLIRHIELMTTGNTQQTEEGPRLKLHTLAPALQIIVSLYTHQYIASAGVSIAHGLTCFMYIYFI